MARAQIEHGEPVSALDYACEEMANGATWLSMSKHLSQVLGLGSISPDLVRKACTVGEENAEQKLAAARALRARLYAEQGVDIADDVLESRDHIAKAKLRIEVRQQLAKWDDPEHFAEKQAQVNVSIGSLHLAALQAPLEVRGIVNPPPVPELTAQVVDAEEVTISDDGSD